MKNIIAALTAANTDPNTRVTQRAYDGVYELSVFRNDPRYSAEEIAEVGIPFPQAWVTTETADAIAVDLELQNYYNLQKTKTKKVAA